MKNNTTLATGFCVKKGGQLTQGGVSMGKLPRCDCGAVFRDGESFTVDELPELVRSWLTRGKQYTISKRLCVECIRAAAPPFGFPLLSSHTDPTRRRTGACAAQDYSCGRVADRNIPHSYKGIVIVESAARAYLQVPIYAPERCLCSGHRTQLLRYVEDTEANSPLQREEHPAKRARSMTPAHPASSPARARAEEKPPARARRGRSVREVHSPPSICNCVANSNGNHRNHIPTFSPPSGARARN